jgi:hypothetical protein
LESGKRVFAGRLSKAVAAAHRGVPHPANEANALVAEYLDRMQLAELGFTSNLGSVSAAKTDCLLFIRHKIDELDKKKREARAKRGGK